MCNQLYLNHQQNKVVYNLYRIRQQRFKVIHSIQNRASQTSMDKKQQINLQHQYVSLGFQQPQDLQDDPQQINQQSSNSQDDPQVTTSNPSPASQSSPPSTNNNSDPSNRPSQQISAAKQNPNLHKNSPGSNQVKKPLAQQRSSLEDDEEQQKIRSELILQFKISQLQKICTTLTSANQKLLDKIEQIQQQNDHYKSRIVSLQTQAQARQAKHAQSLNDSHDQGSANGSVESSNDRYEPTNKSEDQSQLLGDDDEDEKQLEDEVGDIEQMIKEYREELNRAEEVNKSIKGSFAQKIAQLQNQLAHTQQQLTDTLNSNSDLEQQLLHAQQKNDTLQNQVQTLLTQTPTYQQYYEDPTSRNRTESRSSLYKTPAQRNNYHSPRGRFYDEEQQASQFDSSVQAQLEKLIQKLVHELQHERSLKKRMTEEIKRIQKDLLHNQKEIMIKNKKIYQLEMHVLKGGKNHLFNNTPLSTSQVQPFNQKKQDKPKYSIFSPSKEEFSNRNYNSPGAKDLSPKIHEKYLQQRQRVNTSGIAYSPLHRQSPVPQAYNKNRDYNVTRNPNISQSPSSGQTKHLQTFSLLQLLNEPTITLTIKQKLHISLKLVEFYQQKIYQYKNYNLLMLENVLVTNFNRIKLGLIKIRVEEHKRSDEGNQRVRKMSKDEVADGPEKVIWNLGFLLNSLLLDVPTKEDDLGVTAGEKRILSVIEDMLDNRRLNKEVFAQLKEGLEAAFQERLQ